MSILHNSKVLYLFLGLFFLYLYINTGIHSDDWIIVDMIQNYSLSEIIFPDVSKIHVIIFAIPAYYLDYLQYYFFGYGYIYYDFVKILVSLISFYLVQKFFEQYMNKSNSFIISFFIILYITHDSVNYWTIAQPYLLVFSLIMYSHLLINKNKIIAGFIVGLLGSFIVFASPPYVFGLALIFILEKEYKKFCYFILPQILYIIYYFIISNVLAISKGRIDSGLDISKLIKQYILQIGTAFDTFVGPSFWLKIYYAITSLTFLSFIIGSLCILLFYYYYKPKKQRVNNKLMLSLLLIVLLAFGMFSLTGYYPQIAFNLGNRVTVYGSIFLSFLIVLFLMNNKYIATLIIAIFIYSVLGISDHWKSWNKRQLQIIDNISKNKDLKEFNKSKYLFVSFNQYSKLGNISHIEFFSEGITSRIFKLALNPKYEVSTLNRRFYYSKDKEILVDKKYGTEIKVLEKLYIYDSQKDKLFEIDKNNIQKYIESLPKDNRHWLQLLDNDNFITKVILYLMPRLEYAFKN